MTGIGGDCFCLVAKPDAPVWGYNGSGRAAAAVTTEKLLAQGLPRKIPATSPHAVTVPGAIEAWEAILKAHGRFGLDRVLQPAIRYAEDGFADRAARRLRLGDARSTSSSRMPARRSTILVDGAAPEVGSVMRLPALAATLKAIAAGGAQRVLPGRDRRRHRRDRSGGGRLAGGGGSRAPPRRCRRRRSARTIAGSTWSNCRRTGRGSPRWCCSTSSSSSISASSIRPGRSGCISRSKPRGSRSACATRTSPIPPICASRSPACSTRASRRSSAG